MSVEMNILCYQCTLNKNLEKAASLGDLEKATVFGKALMELLLRTPKDISSPVLVPQINGLYKEIFDLDPPDFTKDKADSNRFVMERYQDLVRRVESEEDSLFAGLQMAILGNYLDFAALAGKVSFQELEQSLEQARNIQLDEEVYAALQEDLSKGKKLLYLTDNAGEIGFDRIFAEQIQKKYPHLQITFCVRGYPAVNDATREDAQAVGIPFDVIDNGSNIGGTELSQISQTALTALQQADVIIAKGMGNTETLYGCGYNIYYAFLVKCQRFVQQFGKPLMTPMLVREKSE